MHCSKTCSCCLQDKSRPFHGRYYGASSRKRSGVFKRLHVLVNDRGRRPCLETTFGGQKLQPFIHDGVIAIQPRRGQLTRFHIFVKNHCHLPRNRIIARWGIGQGWKGDIVIMRKGVVHEFVGLRSRDARLADFAVRK
ncbi:hypothetical protein FPV67DRAFT_1435785 [Lyophyllum atratum]|nr:hypothetical protein FPV67DRAFT_1435785 [Lyophyllum atratum]